MRVLLTKIQPGFILTPGEWKHLNEWVCEFFREASVLVVVFILAERWVKESIDFFQALLIVSIGVLLFFLGVKFGLASKKK